MRRSEFLAGVAAMLGTQAPLRVRAADAPVRIAVLGDSLALGSGASRADGGFIFPVFRELLAQRPGSSIDDDAIGGTTVADVLRLEVPRLAGLRYDVVIVCVGGNDVVRDTPAPVFRATYARLLKRIRTLAAGARIVCCGVPDVGVSPLFADHRTAVSSLSRDDDEAVRSQARAAGAAFVDLFATSSRMSDPERFLSRDRFHPSDAGYALFAAALRPVLLRAAR